jgi:hypothetical protein
VESVLVQDSFRGWCTDCRFHVLALCLFSVLNPAVSVVGTNLLAEGMGPASVMQWFQGLFGLVALASLPWLMRGRDAEGEFMFRVWLLFASGLLLIHLRGLLSDDGSVAWEERIQFTKTIFGLLMAVWAVLVIRYSEDAHALLKSLVAGDILVSLIAFVFYVSGVGLSAYGSQGVRAVNLGKGNVGHMLVAFLVALYYAGRTRSMRWLAASVVLLIAVFLSYDRTAQVATITLLGWLLVWRFLMDRTRTPAFIAVWRLLVVLVVALTLYLSLRGGTELVARWTTDLNRGSIGSGRGTLYAAAWKWIAEQAGPGDLIFGMGLQGVFSLMLSATGMEVHTHSDLFDMILIGGLVGLFLYGTVYYVAVRMLKGVARFEYRFAVMVGILLGFSVMSLITGQLLDSPHMIYCLLAGLWCLRCTEPTAARICC